MELIHLSLKKTECTYQCDETQEDPLVNQKRRGISDDSTEGV